MRHFLITLFACSVFLLAGCGDGPAEEAGEELDESIEDIEDAADG